MQIDENTPSMSTTTVRSPGAHIEESEQSSYQNTIVRAIVKPPADKGRSVKEELSSRRLQARMKPIILNPLFDNPEFKRALENLSETRYSQVESF
jgi:hypothetical protein